MSSRFVIKARLHTLWALFHLERIVASPVCPTGYNLVTTQNEGVVTTGCLFPAPKIFIEGPAVVPPRSISLETTPSIALHDPGLGPAYLSHIFLSSVASPGVSVFVAAPGSVTTTVTSVSTSIITQPASTFISTVEQAGTFYDTTITVAQPPVTVYVTSPPVLPSALPCTDDCITSTSDTDSYFYSSSYLGSDGESAAQSGGYTASAGYTQPADGAPPAATSYSSDGETSSSQQTVTSPSPGMFQAPQSAPSSPSSNVATRQICAPSLGFVRYFIVLVLVFRRHL